MVGTGNSWPDFEQFAPQLLSHNSMNASVGIKQQNRLYINPGNDIFPPYTGMPGFVFPPSPSFKREQQNVVQGSHQCLSRHFQNLHETLVPYQIEKEPLHYAAPMVGTGMPVSKSNYGSYPKGFLIFDQSGDQKRLMYAPTPVYLPSTVAENKRGGWLEQERAGGDLDYVKYFPNTLVNDNNVAPEESEMHENTEDIDALLYSDDNVTGCSSDDEVTSTGHSPEMINEHYEKEDQCQETTTEVASSYGPRKRQRLHDGESIKPLPIATVSCARVESHKFANDAESSCGKVHEEEAEINVDFCNSSWKKDRRRIKETLRVLETLVPGAKGDDPSMVIDKVIDYLKSLKHEASALGTKDQGKVTKI